MFVQVECREFTLCRDAAKLHGVIPLIPFVKIGRITPYLLSPLSPCHPCHFSPFSGRLRHVCGDFVTILAIVTIRIAFSEKC